jgi:CRP/FNR family transcriptional regulator, cyclic AMP receptor protein
MTKKEKNDLPDVSLEFLRTHSLFGGLDDESLLKIRELLTRKCFPPGAEIVREGEPGGNLYLIWKGSAEVWKKDPKDLDRPPYRLAFLRKGDSFGEMELIDIQPAVATVRAREETVLLILSNGDLYRIEKSDPRIFTMIIMNLAREISRRLRVMDTLAAQSLFRR